MIAAPGMPANPNKISMSMEIIQTFRILTALTIDMFWGVLSIYSAHCGIDSYIHRIERLQWYDAAINNVSTKITFKNSRLVL